MLPSETAKTVNCELLSENSNSVITWVHPLPDGRLFTVVSMSKPLSPHNTLPQDQFLFGRFSEDGGRTWDNPFYLYTWPEKIASMLYAGSLLDSRGHLHVFALRISCYDEKDHIFRGGIGHVRFDSVAGEAPVYSDVPCLPRYTGSLNGCIETSAGRLVVPFSTLAGNADSKFVSSVIYSDDYGLTWSASNDVSVVSNETNLESGAVEPIVIERKDGSLLMLIRTVLGAFWYSVSRDGGETWARARPTKITSSNSPGSLLRLADGTILLVWNDVMGHPLQGVRYSSARQCLHGAVSDDELQTLRGARILLKKTPGDPDDLHNAYPILTAAGPDEVLLRTFEVGGKGGSFWRNEQAFLTAVRPGFLWKTALRDNWDEWVSDSPAANDGVEIRPTTGNIAYAAVSFPYATAGEITMRAEGCLPGTCQLVLSDCYLDRMNFTPNARPGTWDDQLGSLYNTLTLSETGVWNVSWKDGTVTLTVNGKTTQQIPLHSAPGLNHLGVLFTGDGALKITQFKAKAFKNRWETGIEP